MAKFSNSLKAMGASAFVATSALVGAPATLSFEGMRLAPYYDSVGVKTWCAGETEVGYKKEFSLTECNLLYNIRYGYYSMQTTFFYNDTAKGLVTPEVHAAMVDMSYNVGLPTVKKSGMIRNLNAGNAKAACNYILQYKFAGGNNCSVPGNKICWGVWDRRVKMNQLCLKGT